MGIESVMLPLASKTIAAEMGASSAVKLEMRCGTPRSKS